MSWRSLLYRGSPGSTNVVLVLLGLALLFLSRHLAVEFDTFVIGYSETSTCALAVSLAAGLVVWTQPTDRRSFWIIVGTALLCRLALLTPEPHLSSDIYRYVWDGYVQHHGINPYRYFPGNEHLRWLQEDDIFPYINRRDYAPTIYPPVAQMLFWIATWFSPTLTLMKLTMYALEGVTVFALANMLEQMGRRREEVILYAWSPLCIWEFGSSGHLDAALIAAVCLALLFRLRDRPWLTGFALGAAVMIKFYPLLLFPALWKRRDWRMPAAVVSVIVAGYAVYSSVGMKVFGFAGGYAAEEGMDSGTRYFLLEAARHVPGFRGLGTPAFLAFCAAVFLPLMLWCWRASQMPGTAFLRPAAALAFALMLLFSPHYPWYVAWLLPFLVLLPELPGIVYVYSVFYWLTTQYAEPGPKMFHANSWTYGASAVALLLWLLWRKYRGSLHLPLPWRAVTSEAAR
ncbi:glycosyltransferase family 87 protein [Terriglobus aquaticus]|uniref:Glycosyltransferase 87 family protein n=1 Tax=Terriglobus aquaticus TaxID=940139 RepID=A0ABW9KKH2_9BACT|nr:glycosyltransferase family 87 protein [Terriglobus aquaticus]